MHCRSGRIQSAAAKFLSAITLRGMVLHSVSDFIWEEIMKSRELRRLAARAVWFRELSLALKQFLYSERTRRSKL
jgi:hypothetical protein